MCQCFEAECNHQSLRENCKFFRFPKLLNNAHDGWKTVINRRLDRGPTKYDRLCSCHFEGGDKSHGPTLFGKLKTGIVCQGYPDPKPRVKRIKRPPQPTCESICAACAYESEGSSLADKRDKNFIEILLASKKIKVEPDDSDW